MIITKYDLEPSVLAMHNAISEARDQYEKFKDECERHDYMIVVNFREPSYRKRMAIVDIDTDTIMEYHHTSHGSGSAVINNTAYCNKFSNVPDSHKSSLGAMKTGTLYQGKHGLSCRLHGLEKGVNDNVYSRAIVLHSADNMTDAWIMQNGRAGLSWGCFMLSPAIKDSLINLVKGGCFLYAYY